MKKERPDILNLFRNWFINIFSEEEYEGLHGPISNLKELKSMLRESLKKYNKKLIEEGMHKGLRRGEKMGLQRGLEKGACKGYPI